MAKVARLRELYRKQTYELLGEDVLARTLKPHKKHVAPSTMEIDTKIDFSVPMAPVSPVLPGRGSSLKKFDIDHTRRIFAKKPFELLNGDSLILHSSKPRLVGQKRARTEANQRASKKAKKSGKSMTRGEEAASLFSGPMEPTPLAFNVNALSPKYAKFQSSKVPTLTSKPVSSKSKSETRAAPSSSKKSRGEKPKDAVNPSPFRSAPVVKSQKIIDSASNGPADSVRNSERKRGSERSRDTKAVSRSSGSPDEIIEKVEKKKRRSKADADEDMITPAKRVGDSSQRKSVLRAESRDKDNLSEKPAKELRKVEDEDYAQDTRRKEKRSEKVERDSRRKERDTEKPARKPRRRDDRTERSEGRRREKSSDSVEKDRSRRDLSPERDRESRRRVSGLNKREENGLDTPEKNHVKRDREDSRSRTTTKASRRREGASDGADRNSTSRRRESRSEAVEREPRRKSTRAEGGEKSSRRKESRSEDKEKESRRLESKSQGGEQETRKKLSQSDDVAKSSRRRESRSEDVGYESRRRDSRTEIGDKESRGRSSGANGSQEEFRRDGERANETPGGSRSKENRSQRPDKSTSKRENVIEPADRNVSIKQEPEKVRTTPSSRTVNKPSSSSARSVVLLSAPRTTAIPLSKPVSLPLSQPTPTPSAVSATVPRFKSKPIAALGSSPANVAGTTKTGSAGNGAKSTKERLTTANGGISSKKRPPSAPVSAEQARAVYVKLKERADEYWSQKRYDDFERKALQASEACFEWAIAREREMRKRERHVRLTEKSRIESMKPIREHYIYLVRKVNDDFVKKLENINRKQGADTLKRIVNKAYLRISLLGSLWSREYTTGLQSLKGKLEMNRIGEVDEGDLRLLRFVVDEFSNQRELFNRVSSDTGFGSQEPGTEVSLR